MSSYMREELEEMKYGLVATSWPSNKQHFCLYKEYPSWVDKKALTDELNSDPELGFVGLKFYIREATPAQIRYIKEMLNDETQSP